MQRPRKRVNSTSNVVRSCPNAPTSATATAPPNTVPMMRYSALDSAMPGEDCATIATHSPALDADSNWAQKAMK